MNLFDCLPNFQVIGAAKAGTTTLYDLLKQHPQVFLPFKKEPMFFCHDGDYLRGVTWYLKTYFEGADHYPQRGEASPHYLYWSKKVAPRIHQLYGKSTIRFIVIFRDPVFRAYSWYWNMVKEGMETLPFKKALENEQVNLKIHQDDLQRSGAMTYGYLKGSCYAVALQPFLDLFPHQDFLFLLQEDLVRDFSASIQRLLNFLDLDTSFSINPILSNPASSVRSVRLQKWLRKKSPFRETLMGLFPPRSRHALKVELLQANARSLKVPELDPDIEADLRTRLAPEVRRLEKMIDRDLSAWLPK